jgi:hypothetical protein
MVLPHVNCFIKRINDIIEINDILIKLTLIAMYQSSFI